jgi:hypothetical protein
VPSDTENLQILRSAASQLESAGKKTDLALSRMESAGRKTDLAGKKTDLALSRMQESIAKAKNSNIFNPHDTTSLK